MIRRYCSIFVPILITALSLAACGGNDGGVSRRVRDKKAYKLGGEHAAAIVMLRADETALQDALLDVKARMTNIHDRLGAQASVDYERGFVDYIKANDDSLARVLF